MDDFRTLDVSIEMEGRQREVGAISGGSGYSAVFAYSEDYLSSPNARPISISLPLRRDPFTPEETRNFFEGLLPEGFLRRTVAENNRTDSGDYLSLLEMLGAECLGAIQLKGRDYEAVEPEYRELDPETMFRLASEGATTSADLVVESHLSLTGASGKIGAYRDETGKWYLPVGSAPSTYILKQSHIRYDHIVQNEQLALQTASLMGVSIPPSEIVRGAADPAVKAAERDSAVRMIREGIDGEVLFATERYDRTMEGCVRTISGLPCPLRLHQEDFGQALGIPAANKYERPGEHHMKRMFDLLRRNSASPIEDQMRLWDIIVFHWMIGNTDGHIKNFSLVYDRKLNAVRLAPAYDIVSTVVYDTHSSEMAFSIGGEIEWGNVTRESFVRACDEIRLNRNIFMKRFDRMNEIFRPSLMKAAKSLSAAGYDEAEELAEILLRKRGEL